MKLQSVGIKDFTCPVSIREKSGARQQTVATIMLRAAMPYHVRENCVSVFTDVLNRNKDDLTARILPALLTEVRELLQAEEVRLEMRFPYFIAKHAPVTRTASLMEYNCAFTASYDRQDRQEDLLLTVNVPVTTLCPCSKEISSAGAHNQRAEVELTVRPLSFIWLEELIAMVETCCSCDLYALLKRPDEKYVTEEAYARPMFVEDVVRMVSQKAMEHEDIDWFSVGVESFESIHKHSAYAFVDSSDL